MVDWNYWLVNLIVPLGITVFLMLILTLFFGYLIYKFLFIWRRRLKFFVKYSIFRKKYPLKTVSWCVKCVDNYMDYDKVKEKLFLSGFGINSKNKNKLYETLYIFKKIEKEILKEKMKGGVNTNE